MTDVEAVSFEAPTRIISGTGQRCHVGAALADIGRTRAVLVGTERFRQSVHYKDVMTGLGSAVVGEYHGVSPQSNLREVADLAATLQDASADAVVAVGGGSVLGAVKCAVAVVGEGREPSEIGWSYSPADRSLAIPELRRPKMPILALPTTSGSASETNQFGSVKDEATAEKVRVRDPQLVPRIAILDPELTVSMDRWTTVGTGANAFAHCVEILYSRHSHPVSDALVLAAARMIFRALPRAALDPGDLGARGEMQMATAMSGMALNNSLVCLHHALCHPLGNVAAVPHGVANYVMLPHSLRYNRPDIGPFLFRLGASLGVIDGRDPDQEGGADQTLAAIEEWLAALDGPQRLRDTGKVQHDQLPRIAESAYSDTCIYFNPRRPASPEEILAIYEAAW